jgi:Reverse transcriptase (RNA-dependent DNA polymerase)
MRWKQRSSCNWLDAGDNNTKYFHAVANAKHNTNTSMPITREDGSACTQSDMEEVAYEYFKGIMGTLQQTNTPFDLTGRVGPSFHHQLAGLDNQITEDEVQKAIASMPDGKSSGPDGFPIEFYKKFWFLIKDDVMALVTAVHNNSMDVSCLNKAQITLIPKREGASKIKEFRPISVINTIIKIITKLYSTRLQPFLPVIISKQQTAFVEGRSIMESFMTARELLHLYNKKKVPAVLFKVDF